MQAKEVWSFVSYADLCGLLADTILDYLEFVSLIAWICNVCVFFKCWLKLRSVYFDFYT